jgi:hypothetical protein
MNVLACAARAFASDGFPVIIKLKRDANDIVTGRLQECGHDGRIDPP